MSIRNWPESERPRSKMSLDDLKTTLELPKYRDWINYERLLPANIESAYRNLTLYR